MTRPDDLLTCFEWLLRNCLAGKKFSAGIERSNDQYRAILYISTPNMVEFDSKLQIDSFSEKWLAEAVANEAKAMLERLGL